MPWKVSHMEEERFKFILEVEKNEKVLNDTCIIIYVFYGHAHLFFVFY